MAKYGQSINLYLMDGDATGRYEAKLGNWNIITYKIPYGMVDESKQLEHIDSAGVYFLFSEQDGHRAVYVGESEDLLKRLTQHTPDKDHYDWYEAIAFVATDSSLDKGKIKYLENCFYNIINDAGAYQLLNRNEPRKSTLSNAVQDSMAALIDNVKLVVPVIGQDPFKPLINNEQDSDINPPVPVDPSKSKLIYLVNENQRIHATARYYSDKLVTLLSGSIINEKLFASLPESVRKLRLDLESNQQLVNNQLMDNLDFSSLSGAATFVYGHPASGPSLWRDIDGNKLFNEIDNPPIPPQPPVALEKLLFYIQSTKKQVDATGRLNADGSFTVLKGSLVSPEVKISLPKKLLENREYAIDHGVVIGYRLQQSIQFSSSSSAAMFVYGRSSSGPTSWKTEDGTCLGDLT